MKQEKNLLPVIVTILIFVTGCGKPTNNSKQINSEQNKTEGSSLVNKNIYDISVKTMDGEVKKMSDYQGKVMLIVNVASKCGYTPQYDGLEKIYEKYNPKGFEVLGFPSNDFGEQEPGTNDEIRTFCESKYNVTFPLFDKVKVLGNEKSPLYDRLINNSDPKGDVAWNFEKFVIDKEGNIVRRFKSKTKPESEELISAIELELSK